MSNILNFFCVKFLGTYYGGGLVSIILKQ